MVVGNRVAAVRVGSDHARGFILLLMLIVLGARPVHAGPPTPTEPVQAQAPLAEPSLDLGLESSLEFATPDPDHMQSIWRVTSVAWPLVPLGGGVRDYQGLTARLEQREAMLAGQQPAPSVRGVVDLDRERAVGVWISALETVRVRQISGSAPLRFIRGVDGHAAVVEPGRAVAPGPGGERRWELQQPPSTGAVWSIEADDPTQIQIERVEQRSPRYASVEVEHALLEWIAAGLPDADLPALLEPSDALPGRLRLDAALGRELLALDRAQRDGDQRRAKQRRSTRRFDRAVEAWRMLAAMTALDRERPAVRPYFGHDPNGKRPLPLKDTRKVRLATDDSRDYRLAETPRRWVLERKGAGQLRIAARTWAPAGQALIGAELRVYADGGGRVIAQVPLSGHQAYHSVDPNTALPHFEPLVTEAGEPVGGFAEATIVLAPGRHEYVIELIGGPALLAIETHRRIEASSSAVRGWTPRKRARAAERGLRRSDSPAAPWLELLLAAQTHAPLPMTAADARFVDLAKHSPLLAAASLAVAAADTRLDDASIAALVERVHPWLVRLDRDSSIDPGVRGELRTRWLALIAGHGSASASAEFTRALVTNTGADNDPIAELPVEGLRLLAELLGPTHGTLRSPALAVLELARSRAPADSQLRGQMLRLWSDASRWSRRRPIARPSTDPDSIPGFDPTFRPIGRWMVARETMPADEVARANTWVRLGLGEPIRFVTELSDDAPSNTADRRMRLLDVHVSTPTAEPDPVLLRVDERRWWSPQLTGIQRHRFAVGPGVHELELDGPVGTLAWAELPPATDQTQFTPAQLGRLEQMYSLPNSVWQLPGPAVPGFIRLELRWPKNLPPGPVEIHVCEGEGDGPVRTVVFDPADELDRDALPLGDTPWASGRHDVVLPIAAATTEIHFKVVGDLPIAASLSLRRGPTTSDAPPQTKAVARSVKPRPDVFAGLASLDHEALLTELGELSRALLEHPDDLEARARRAGLLLMVGETGHARADLVRLATWAEREGQTRSRLHAIALLAELDQRFDALIDPDEITVADPTRVAQPELIEPALAAVAGADREALEPWLETWAFVREAELDAGLTRVDAQLGELRRAHAKRPSIPNIDAQLLLGAITRAQLISTDPTRAREAGRAWLSLYGRVPGSAGSPREPVAVGLASVQPLLMHLDDPRSDARDAGLGFGLARELEPLYGHTTVRRLAFVAALRSDWSRISHSEDSAGFEHLELPVSELEPSPSAEIREALLVAPWPASESEQLGPARKGVLAWDATPGTVTAELWCRAARPDRAEPGSEFGTAKLSLRLRGKGRRSTDIEDEIEVRDGELQAVELPIARRGRHQLEVTLGDDPIWACSWRTRIAAPASKADPAPSKQVVEAHRRGQWWTAEARRDVELIVLGPASVTLEVRAIANPRHQPQTLVASIERLDFDRVLDPEVARSDQGALSLATEVEGPVITESRRRFEVSEASTHTLLLTEPVPHRIRLRTDQGRALIRARLRRDRGDIAPPTQVSIRELDIHDDEIVETLDWRTAGPNLPVLARDRVTPIRNRFGTLDMRVAAGLDDIRDVDDLRPRPGLIASVGWHREIVENSLWMAIEAETRLRDQTSPAGGGSLRIAARLPILGVRMGANVAVLAQPFAGQPETSVRIYGFLDRPTWLGPHVQLRPGLTVGLRWQSLDPERVAAATTELEPNPGVYLRYIHDHPVMLRPELELRIYPLQDMAVWAKAEVLPNSDIHSLDHVNAELGATGIMRRPRPWVPLWALSYQASPRFEDANRSTFFVRHRIEAELGLAVWARDTARVAFGATNQLFFSSVAPIRDVIQIWIRVDAAFGRRMRDYGPREQWFPEPWAPRAWGDDEHQARSTQAPRER